MARSAIAFLAGLGTGYVEETNRAEKQKREDEDRALRNEAARLSIDAVKQAKADQQTLRDAVKPATLMDGTAVTSPDGNKLLYKTAPDAATLDSMQAEADMRGEQTGQAPVPVNLAAAQGLNASAQGQAKIYTDPAQASKAQSDYNAPGAMDKRTIAALRSIDPLKAMDAEHTQTQRGREDIKFKQEQDAIGKKLAAENVLESLKPLRAGDGIGFAKIFNAKGDATIVGDVTMTPEPRDVGGQAITSYTATFQVKDKDGNIATRTINSQDASMALMSFEKKHALDIQAGNKKQSQDNWNKTFDQNAEHFKENKRLQEKQIGISAGNLSIAKEEAARKAEAFKEERKVPASVRLAYKTLESTAEAIDKAAYKAQAEGTFNVESASAQKLMADRLIVSNQMKALLAPHLPKAAGVGDVAGILDAPGAAPVATPAAKADPHALPAPIVTKPVVATNLAASQGKPSAPVRSTDGGKTWSLDIPATIRDPSVPYYRQIPNPRAGLAKQAFKSRAEAEAAFNGQ